MEALPKFDINSDKNDYMDKALVCNTVFVSICNIKLLVVAWARNVEFFAEVEVQGFIGRMTFNEIYHGKKGNSFKK